MLMMIINSYNSLFLKPALLLLICYLSSLFISLLLLQERVARQISVPFLICAATLLLVTICDLAHICFTSCFLSVSCMKAFNKTWHTPLKKWFDVQIWVGFGTQLLVIGGVWRKKLSKGIKKCCPSPKWCFYKIH